MFNLPPPYLEALHFAVRVLTQILQRARPFHLDVEELERVRGREQIQDAGPDTDRKHKFYNATKKSIQ